MADLTPMPANMWIGALLMHITDGLTGHVPAPYALANTGDKLVLLQGQRIAATTTLAGVDDVRITQDRDWLADKTHDILDEAQDLVMSSLHRTWPAGPASHPAAGWRGPEHLRLGYFPLGDLAAEPVLELPLFEPPTGPPRVAG